MGNLINAKPRENLYLDAIALEPGDMIDLESSKDLLQDMHQDWRDKAERTYFWVREVAQLSDSMVEIFPANRGWPGRLIVHKNETFYVYCQDDTF